MSRPIDGHDVAAYLRRLDTKIKTAEAEAIEHLDARRYECERMSRARAHALREAKSLAASHFGPVVRGEVGA